MKPNFESPIVPQDEGRKRFAEILDNLSRIPTDDDPLPTPQSQLPEAAQIPAVPKPQRTRPRQRKSEPPKFQPRTSASHFDEWQRKQEESED